MDEMVLEAQRDLLRVTLECARDDALTLMNHMGSDLLQARTCWERAKEYGDATKMTLAGLNDHQQGLSILAAAHELGAQGLKELESGGPLEAITLCALAAESLLKQSAGRLLGLQLATRSTVGRLGADALHGKVGGSRDKRAAIQAIWASGKYSSRDLCAEQECAALEMSLSTARKALRNTPEPER